MTSIDIKTRYKFLKSPSVPFCLKACGDELVERAYLGQLKVLPECMFSIASHAVEDRKLNANKIEELIGTFSTDRKVLTPAQEDSRRIAECTKLSNHILFAVLLEFLRRCRESSLVHLSYPRNGWIILGPPYSNNYEMVDESRFQKALTILLDTIFDEFPLKRDMLCYTMSILSQMVQIANENCRSQPAQSAMVRYQIANLFAPILIGIRCDKCKCNFTEVSKPCDICSYIPNILQKPFEVDILDRWLKHIPTQFWRNILINIRHIPLTDESDEAIHRELTHYFQNGPPGKTKPTEKVTKATSTKVPEPNLAKPEKIARKTEPEPKKQPKAGKAQPVDEVPQPKVQTPAVRRLSLVASQDEVDDIKDENNDGGDGQDNKVEDTGGSDENDEGPKHDTSELDDDEHIVGDGKVGNKAELQLAKQKPDRKSRDSQPKSAKTEDKSKKKPSNATPSSSGKLKATPKPGESGSKKRPDKSGQKKSSAKPAEQTKKSAAAKKLVESKSKPGSSKKARSAKIPSRLNKAKH